MENDAKKLSQSTIDRLLKLGLYLHKSGGVHFDSPSLGLTKMPICAIWEESEELTEEEIKTLGEIVAEFIKKYYPDVTKDFKATSANMIIFRKVDGKWTFRRLTWETGPTWFLEHGSLEEIGKKILN